MSRNFKEIRLFFHLHFSIACLDYSNLMFVFRKTIIINDITILWYVIEAKHNLEKYYIICNI